MLRTYGPNCDGSLLEAGHGEIPPGATWIDLEEPTRDEEKLVERCIGLNVPTQEEMAEIEPSSRLFERDGVLFMTMSALRGVVEGHPTTTPISFVFTGERLVTVRYATPKPILAFAEHVRREPELARDASTVLVRLLDAIIDRLADELEGLGSEIETLSDQSFAKMTTPGGSGGQADGTADADRRAQTLLAKIRYSAVSTNRLLGFLGASSRMHEEANANPRNHLSSLSTDVGSLIDHSSFLGDNLTFLLDASLGLISVEQNAAMKLFSWAALVFLPPTLVAGIYGMNFEYMPELKWLHGYTLALVLMLASGVLPLWYFKRRGWI